MDRIIIQGGRPLRGEITVSGSKNASLPLMAAALLADSPSTIRNIPDLADIRTMAAVLRSLGAAVEFSDHTLTIDPAGFSVAEAPYDTVRKMRASIYVLGPMLARLGQAKVSLPGGCTIGPRPIDLHLKGFEHLGAQITLDHGYILAEAQQLKGSDFDLTGAAGSSVGATCNVILAASLAEGETVIRGAAREPDINELCRFMRAMGATIEGDGTSVIRVGGVKSLRGTDHTVCADRIEAGTFMVAAAITDGDLRILNAPVEDMDATIAKCREAGIAVETTSDTIRVRSTRNSLRPISVQTAPYPGFPTDMQAQFMALLAVAPGTSIIRETIYVDRFLHAAEMLRMGANIRVMAGLASIEGVHRLSGAPVMASDLRASAALVIAGLAAEGTTIVNRIYHIDRGYEAIEKKLRDVGAAIARVSDSETDES